MVLIQEVRKPVDKDGKTGLEAACKAVSSNIPGLQNWKVAAECPALSKYSCGVATLVRGAVKIITTPEAVSALRPPSMPGRVAQCTLSWAGHRVHVCNVYLPSGTKPKAMDARLEYVKWLKKLSRAVAATDNLTLLVGGDFNFVDDPALDSRAGRGGRKQDSEAAAALRECGDLVDCHRSLHRGSKDFTYIKRKGSHYKGISRLDRFYASRSLLEPYRYISHSSVESCMLDNGERLSDHDIPLMRLTCRHGSGVSASGGLHPCASQQAGAGAWSTAAHDMESFLVVPPAAGKQRGQKAKQQVGGAALRCAAYIAPKHVGGTK